jgi:hypothetical protein
LTSAKGQPVSKAQEFDIRTLNEKGLEGTHPLEATEGGCQDIEGGEGVSQTHNQNKQTWGTYWGPQREGQVRTKEID